MLGRCVGLAELLERARERMLARCTGILRRYGYGQLADEVCENARFGWITCPLPPEEGDCESDQEFQSVAELACDIDALLATLEGDRRTATLAADCRRELDLLLVLADLCVDIGLPRAAEEARFLHRRAENAS